ncbi:hypothetical protein QQP08_004287 [Theobroma cacao]|nr:hypothetical protein QQP08_004287 [Theobroma cacao]
MRRNALMGTLPTFIRKLQNLETLLLGRNNFSGEILYFIDNLSRLFELILYGNNFEGRIPLVLRNCKKIQNFDLTRNKLSGSIPEQLLGVFTSLIWVNISFNSLTSPFQSDFGNLKNLKRLYVYENKLSGEIPKILDKCSTLASLDMARNFFQVPKGGVFNKSSGFSIVGNKNLCGGILEIKLPKCNKQKLRKKGNALLAKAIIVMILRILFASILVVFFCIRFCKQRFGKKLILVTLFGDSYLRVSSKKLLQAFGGFASSYLIGVGSFGSVYKSVLHQ